MSEYYSKVMIFKNKQSCKMNKILLLITLIFTLGCTFPLQVTFGNPTPTPTLEPIATDEFIPPATPLPPTPQIAPTSTRLPTPTPLPPNPATLSESQIYDFLGRAILVTLLAFIVVAILLRLRKN